MKKGFTLIELLIVMIIVSTLVTIALPKYQSALERGRALEGLRNVQYAAEYANAKHMACVATNDSNCGYNNFVLPNTDKIKNRFFTLSAPTEGGEVTASRVGSGWKYKFTAVISADGYIESITCGNRNNENTNDCENLDLTGNLLMRE